jgi:hypothetical protein
LATKQKQMQNLIRLYKERTGESEVDMHKVAEFAAQQGWPLPKPFNPLDELAKQFSKAAREEIRYDPITKKPYRGYHAVPAFRNNKQLSLWVDIDEAPRSPMQKSLINRREQMVGDGLQLTLDADHWNSLHPDEDPIIIPMDFTDDIEWRKNAPDDEDKAA